MRIAIWHNLPSGGGKRALYDQVKGLVGRGHSVHVWCPPTAEREFLPLTPLVASERVVEAPGLTPELTLPARSGLTTVRRAATLVRSLDAHAARCAAEIAAGGFDLALVHPCRLARVPALGRHLRAGGGGDASPPPAVLYLQEPNRALYEAAERLPWLAPPASESRPLWNPRVALRVANDHVKLQALRRLAREEWENVRGYDRVLVNSYFSRESVLRAYGVLSQVCYLGVDTARFPYAPRGGRGRERSVVGLGSYVREKNVGFVIESVARVPVHLRPRLVWIGNSDWGSEYLPQMRELAARLGVDFDPHVGIPEERVTDLLTRAAMMVYCPRLEPFGYAPLEANAVGMPVVAIAEGGMRETIRDGENGLVVDARPEAVAEGIVRLLSDPALAERLGERAARLVREEWSLDAALDRLEANLREVAAAGAAGAPSTAAALPAAAVAAHAHAAVVAPAAREAAP